MLNKETVTVNPTEVREQLFRYLKAILKRSEKKFLNSRGKDTIRLSYGRLLVSAIDSYGRLLKEAEIDDLVNRIEKIEEKLNART